MDLFKNPVVDLTEVRRRLQERPLESPWADGRDGVNVLLWCKKDAKGKNVGLMLKADMIRGTPAPLVFLDLDTAKKYAFADRAGMPSNSVFFIRYEKTDVNKSKWPYSDDVRVVVVRKEDVAGIVVSQEFENTLSDEFSQIRHN